MDNRLEEAHDMVNLLVKLDAVPWISKRFALKHYLKWSDEQILENEQLLLEEGVKE
jgi:hypothetical protein